MKTPPISRIAMRNFKSVRNADVTLAPLTVIVGRNSAGKSSLLQALLFLSMNANLEGGRTFRLNGRPLKLGEFQDILNDAAKSGTDPRLELEVSVSTEHRPQPSRASRFAAGDSPRIEAVAERIETRTDMSFTLKEMPGEPGVAQLAGVTVHVDRDDLGGVDFTVDPDMLPRSTQEQESSDGDEDSSVHMGQMVTVRGNARPWEAAVTLERMLELDRWEVRLTIGQALAFCDLIQGATVFSSVLDLLRPTQLERAVARRATHSRENPMTKDDLRTSPNVQKLLSRFHEEINSLAPASKSGYEPLVKILGKALEEIARLGEPDTDAFDVMKALSVVWNSALTQVVKEHTTIDTTEQLREVYRSSIASPGAVRDAVRAFRVQLLSADWNIGQVSGVLDFAPYLPTELGPAFSDRSHRSMEGSSVVRFRQPRASYCLQQRIRYLGPLRMEPQYSYSTGVESSHQAPLGVRGEGAIEALRPDAPITSNYVLPPGQQRVGGRQSMRLVDAVSLWLAYFTNKHTPVEVRALTAYGRKAYFGGHTFPHVGTGASQLLPILALCLQAREGTVILLEQPELHLHPSLQQMLTEFLLVMVENGRQIIIETHSEYIITRLRRIAITEPTRREAFGILFAENDDDQGTTYRQVSISPNGGIEDWPHGFFDEVSKDLEVIMRAAMEQENS